MGIVIGILILIILAASVFFLIRGYKKNKKTQTIIGAIATRGLPGNFILLYSI